MRARVRRQQCSLETVKDAPHSGLGQRIWTFIGVTRNPIEGIPTDIADRDRTICDVRT